MERKTCWQELRSGSGAEPGFDLSGYASIKNEVDAYQDVILDGAYGDLDEFVQSGFVAVGHNHAESPVGYIVSAREDHRGLYVTMAFHSTPGALAAKTVAEERLAAGKRVGLSIGYLPVKWRFDTRDDRRVRLLEKIELKEFSLVSLPAAPGAVATSVGRASASASDVLHLESAWAEASRISI
jgi:HK97 family phage prohead protease